MEIFRMLLDVSLIKDIALPFVGIIITAWLTNWFKNRPKILAYYGHVSAFDVDNQGDPLLVNTHSVIIENSGNLAAKNVRLGHHNLPNVSVFPNIYYEIRGNPGGTNELVFPTLVPKERVTISYLYFHPITYDQINSYIKSDEGLAKVVNVNLMRVFPPLVVYGYSFFAFTGMGLFLYLLILLLRFLYKTYGA